MFAVGEFIVMKFLWTVYLGGLYFAFVGAETKDRMSGSLQRQLRELTYPDDSEMVIFCPGNPIGRPGRDESDVSGIFFEANYGLVRDQESLASRARKQRAAFSDHKLLTRATVYSILESKFEALGLPGRACLLRSICETSKLSVDRDNGLIGDLLRILLTPSSSANENLPTEYVLAEQRQLESRINHHSRYDTGNNHYHHHDPRPDDDDNKGAQ